jgi:MraZ protein
LGVFGGRSHRSDDAVPITFLGIFQHTLDDKNRLAIPARFREQLARAGDPLLYSVARPGHVLLFPQDTWDRFVERLLEGEATASTDEFYYLRRQIALSGEICNLDTQGRITLNANQVRIANLGRDVVLFGNFSIIEVWPRRVFEEKQRVIEQQDKEGLWKRLVSRL